MTTLNITFQLTVARRFDDATGVHVGWCPALDLFSQGRTAEEAEAAIVDAVGLYLKHCHARGILFRVLRARGFVPGAEPPTPAGDGVQRVAVEPADSAFGHARQIEVPMHLVMAAHAKGAAACPS